MSTAQDHTPRVMADAAAFPLRISADSPKRGRNFPRLVCASQLFLKVCLNLDFPKGNPGAAIITAVRVTVGKLLPMPLPGLLRAMTTEEFLHQLASHESQIMGFLWSVSPSSDVAEDLFQQAVITMWEKVDQFESGSNFVAWGCQIAKLKALEFARKRKRLLFDNDLVAKLADEHASEDVELRLLRRQALSRCLAKLKDDDRMLVEKCYLGDRAIWQVAEEVGRSAKGVYSSLARIRKLLHRCVQSSLAQEVD